MGEINVVPYIDVMLVLLIIFMTTTSVMLQGIQVDLPKVDNKPITLDSDDETLVISVTAEGSYILERGDEEETSTELKFISDYTSKVLRQQPATPVFIRGDENVPYGIVAELLSTLQLAGAESVGLITEVP